MNWCPLLTSHLTLISGQIPAFQEALESRAVSGVLIYLTTFQMWTFYIVSLLCDSTIVAISVGIVGYYIKGIKVYWALLFGILSKYLIVLIFIGLLLYSSGQISSFFNEVTKRIDSGQYILIFLHFLSTLCFSYIGLNFGKRTAYFDANDKDLFYFCGIPKKVWLLLFISYVPVANFLSKLTIVQIYQVTDKITSMNYWKDSFSLSNIFSEDSAGGFTGLLGHIMVICFVWAVAIGLFSYGFNTIRNRDTRHRWIRIIVIYILIPVIIVIIPIIRNRTWFF
ncbi:MAG: hypothetical protein HQK99_17300 [Nitrospirae bacterium]|nr:hypothetical protein [Nitrospirota bacterium]